MEDYSFWADLLASYRASPDVIKALWLLVPLGMVFGAVALVVAFALRLIEPRNGVAATPGQPWETSEFQSSATGRKHSTIKYDPTRMPGGNKAFPPP